MGNRVRGTEQAKLHTRGESLGEWLSVTHIAVSSISMRKLRMCEVEFPDFDVLNVARSLTPPIRDDCCHRGQRHQRRNTCQRRFQFLKLDVVVPRVEPFRINAQIEGR